MLAKFEINKYNYNLDLEKCGRVYLLSSTQNEIQLRRMMSRSKCLSNSSAYMEECSDIIKHKWPMFFADDVKVISCKFLLTKNK